MKKERLDVILVQKGLVESRDKAKRTIMAGLVTVDGRVEDKAGQKFDPELEFAVKQKLCPYVSRGGLKLEKAMNCFPIDLKDGVCMDMGASTGGFTDCMLQNGAVKVYAVDVGYGQLAWTLRCDKRVVNMERTNIRHVTAEQLQEPVAFFSVDVSFISLKHIFPVAAAITAPEAEGVCLVKPQFEAGKEKVGKKGVVREAATHREVIEAASGFAVQNGFSAVGLDFSPIKGPEGNIEFLMHVRKCVQPEGLPQRTIEAVVSKAHESL